METMSDQVNLPVLVEKDFKMPSTTGTKPFHKEACSSPISLYSDATFDNVNQIMEAMWAEPKNDWKEAKEFGEKEVHKVEANGAFENNGELPRNVDESEGPVNENNAAATSEICLRKGCNNPGVTNIDWDGEYCSNECVVEHCQDVFKEWVEEQTRRKPVCDVCGRKEEEEDLAAMKEDEEDSAGMKEDEEDSAGMKEGGHIEDLEFYCGHCYTVKVEEFEKRKEKLLARVWELAEAQTDFGGSTISREMFKDKRKAGEYNFNKDHPSTLRDLCARITSKFKTFREFKYESKLWVQRLKCLLLEKCENDLQYIEWEISDFVKDLLKDEDGKIDDTSDVDAQFEINQDTLVQ